MTLFGKLLVLCVFALLGGAAALVVKNFEPANAPAPVYSDVLENIRTTGPATTSPETPTTPTATPTTTPVLKKEIPEAPASIKNIAPPLPAPIEPPVASMPAPDWDAVNAKTRGALANILCTAKAGDSFQPLSGSGVFIDPRGIILTNAHVAQYVLLTGGGEKSNLLDCVVRVGNPAAPRYRVGLLFLSPRWLTENARHILEESPKENGEDDYALLAITGTTNPAASLPDSFPFLPLREKPVSPDTKDAFLAAGYPAGFLGGIAVQRELWSVSSFATIASRYTFTEHTLDIVGLGGNLLAQKGASGGALVDYEGTLAGLIVTATVEGATDARDVRALTVDYINRAFTREAGFALYDLSRADLPALLSQFSRDILPSLRTLLTTVLEKTGS